MMLMVHNHRQMWASLRTHHFKPHNRHGFTIVELLIVIVVIGILAAITIVGFNGVQNKAKTAAAQSAASQASKKIAVFAATNSDTFPETPADIGLNNTDSMTYQLTTNNSSSPRTYCVTVTSSGKSYFVTNTNTTPTLGACPGHGVDGAPSVTNYFLNPRFDGSEQPMTATGTTASIATCNGSNMAYAVTSTSAAATMRLSSNQTRRAVVANQPVFLGVDVYNAASGSRIFIAGLRFYDTTGASIGELVQTINSPATTIASNSMQRLTVTTTAPAGAVSVGVNINRNPGGGAVNGDVYCADNVYLSDAPGGFADGSTNGWVWNGPVNNATSTGSQQ